MTSKTLKTSFVFVLGFSALLVLTFAGCQPKVDEAPESTAAAADAAASEPAPSEPAKAEDRQDAEAVAEAWQSAFHEPDNVDSVAYWHGRHDGEDVAWILATGKESHDLLVYDAATGETVRRVGGEGGGPGEFRRPNGIMVAGDWALVVERDNHRVQALRLPAFDRPAMIGEDVLRRPYGATVVEGENGAFELFVTDNYETEDGEIPPASELGERVKHFHVTAGEDAVTGELVRAFGDTEGLGVLTKVETLLADPAAGRLLIADEHETGMTLKVYDLEGVFTGDLVGQGHFFHEAEGLALRTCGDGGYWIATDQAPDLSLFRLFDRQSFAYRGTFVGQLTANTDGVTQTDHATDTFPEGAFFAVHDDQGVTAFDWRAVANALDLDC